MCSPLGRVSQRWVGRAGGRDSPEVQVVVAGEVIVKFDAVLEGLHGGVGESHGRVILLAEVGGCVSLHWGGWGC